MVPAIVDTLAFRWIEFKNRKALHMPVASLHVHDAINY